MKFRKLPNDVLENTLNYLALKPYAEVAELIKTLIELKVIDESEKIKALMNNKK